MRVCGSVRMRVMWGVRVMWECRGVRVMWECERSEGDVGL